MTKEEDRKYHKDRRARLKAQGICTNCGKRAAILGQTLCEPCQQKKRAYNKVWRNKYRTDDREMRHIVDLDGGYVLLAAAIVKAQMRAYRHALQAYELRYNTWEEKEARAKVLEIERELLSPYYAILTMQVVDLQGYIMQRRKNILGGTKL